MGQMTGNILGAQGEKGSRLEDGILWQTWAWIWPIRMIPLSPEKKVSRTNSPQAVLTFKKGQLGWA